MTVPSRIRKKRKWVYVIGAIVLSLLLVGSIVVTQVAATFPPIFGTLGFTHRWSHADKSAGIEAVAANPTVYEWAPDLRVRTDGNPVIVWEQILPAYEEGEIWLAYWNGAKWRGMANANGPDKITNTASNSTRPSLVLMGNNPVISWTEQDVDQYGNPITSRILVTRWDGSSWRGFAGTAPDEVSADPQNNWLSSLALNPITNQPAVLWSHNQQILFREWNGTAWVGKLGATPDVINGTDLSASYPPRLAFSPTGTPFATWMFDPPVGDKTQIYFRRWDGASWRGYTWGGSDNLSVGYNYNYAPSLAVDAGGLPMVAWSALDGPGGNNAVLLKRWNGSAWVGMAGQAQADIVVDTDFGVGRPSLAVAPDGKPGVAWFGASLDPDVFYSRWDGTSWVGLTGAAPQAVTNDANEPYDPRLVFDANGKPMISWMQEHDPLSSTWDLFFARWL